MDFDDTPEEAEFRAGARTFLDKNAKRREPGAGMVYRAGNESPQFRQQAKDWQARKADAGYAGITWSKDWGGRGGTPIQQVIYDQEEAKYAVPRGLFDIGLGMCIPTLCTWGTQAQRDRYSRTALRGEEIWCQLFSEPVAGSDLAGIRTRAERDGDGWRVNGHKIWTSGAHYSQFAILVARTDPHAPKHKGLTFFFLDMKSKGIETRPIKQMWGGARFNEVFLTDVRIPDSQRLGKVGEGWKVALYTLGNERFSVGTTILSGPTVSDMLALARTLELDGRPAIEKSVVREKLVDWYIKEQGLKFTIFRNQTALSRGQAPGPESSIAKVVSPAQTQEMASFALDMLGTAGGVMDEALAHRGAWFQEEYLAAPGARVAGGTDEIMRNIIAERVLGLPGDIRVDKDLPYNQLPTGRRR